MTSHDATLVAGEGTRVAPQGVFDARHLIDGAFVDSASGKTFMRRAPASDDAVTRAAWGDEAETHAAIGVARAAFDDGRWSRLSGKDRAAVLLCVADLIDRDRARLALFETIESGKPISQAEAEMESAADLWRHAAALARTLHGDSHNTLGPDMLGLVYEGTNWRRGDDHAVEFPVSDRFAETPLCAGGRLHGSDQAV